MTKLVAERPTEPSLLPVCGDLLTSLVETSGWLPKPFAAPSPDHYCQYLLYCDPLERFSVVSFVWGPGQKTPIHDHRVWGATGMLKGSEISTPYRVTESTGGLTPGQPVRLDPGQVDFVSPRLGDIHEVRNAFDDDISISIHVYGANIGSVERRIYNPETGAPSPFVSGYTSDIIPNIW